jgi:hypothetical protein
LFRKFSFGHFFAAPFFAAFFDALRFGFFGFLVGYRLLHPLGHIQ